MLSFVRVSFERDLLVVSQDEISLEGLKEDTVNCSTVAEWSSGPYAPVEPLH